MKRKLIIIFSLLLTSINCFTQNAEPKHYLDSSKGFSGYATAIFLGNLSELDNTGAEDFFEMISDEIGDKLTAVSKLTKNNNWLFRQAMNEWDYEKDEVYLTICSESKQSSKGLLFFIIVKGEDDFSWIAYIINEDDDLDNLNIFN